LDILAVLADNAGRVVPKEELIARVWLGIFVEESNLKIQVSALRRATATSSRFPVAGMSLSLRSGAPKSLWQRRRRSSQRPQTTICRSRRRG
jgi:hypothetical protein